MGRSHAHTLPPRRLSLSLTCCTLQSETTRSSRRKKAPAHPLHELPRHLLHPNSLGVLNTSEQLNKKPQLHAQALALVVACSTRELSPTVSEVKRHASALTSALLAHAEMAANTEHQLRSAPPTDAAIVFVSMLKSKPSCSSILRVG